MSYRIFKLIWRFSISSTFAHGKNNNDAGVLLFLKLGSVFFLHYNGNNCIVLEELPVSIGDLTIGKIRYTGSATRYQVKLHL